MPKKLSPQVVIPTLVAERLHIWGRCIRTQRVRQRVPARDLCERIGISDATLRRLERGDPGAGASTYLTALLVLGMLDMAVPMLPVTHWSADENARARPAKARDDYF